MSLEGGVAFVTGAAQGIGAAVAARFAEGGYRVVASDLPGRELPASDGVDALAWEAAPFGIRVNSVSPGSVDTPMLRGDVELEAARYDRSVQDVRRDREAEQAFGRWADPAEIAETIFFLAGPGASFVTGADLLVDCGWVAK